MSAYLLAIDQGTTNTKALLVDRAGKVIARASRPLAQTYPRPGWVEQDATAIWYSVSAAIDDLLATAGDPALAGIAISNQRETVAIWERATGALLGPAVSWQCGRGADLCSALRAQGLEQTIHERSGLTIDTMFSASKMRWLLDHLVDGRQRAAAGDICLGTIDSWVLWNLTGGVVHACDTTNASRTLLFGLRELGWDSVALGAFGIPPAALPTIHPSSHIYGETVTCGRLPAGLPIATLIGDSHAALFGHARHAPGSVKATYGTGSSLMTSMPGVVLSQHGLSTTVAWSRARTTYALEGNIYVTGAAVQWLGEIMGLADGSALESLAGQVSASGGVYIVPAFAGLGAPHWQQQARGLICGMTRGTGRAHLARAVLEAIAYQVRDVFDVMAAEAGLPLRVLMADGGASRNDLLMQMQADMLDTPVLRSTSPDLSALGAAYLAGLALGIWGSEDEVAGLAEPGDLFEPRLTAAQREALYAGWKEALWRTTAQVGDR